MVPAPTTTSSAPGGMASLRRPCTTQASGSTRAPASQVTTVPVMSLISAVTQTSNAVASRTSGRRASM
jgi:hypothetical protein